MPQENQELGEELVASHLDQVDPCHWLETNDYECFLAGDDS